MIEALIGVTAFILGFLLGHWRGFNQGARAMVHRLVDMPLASLKDLL